MALTKSSAYQISPGLADRAARLARGSNVYKGGTNNATRPSPMPRVLPDHIYNALQNNQTGKGTRFGGGTTGGGARQGQPSLDGLMGAFFDPSLAAMQRRLNEQMGAIDVEAQAAQRRLNEMFQFNQEGLESSHERARRQLLDQLAAQGILKSGINISEQEELGQDFQRALQQLQMGVNNSMADIMSQANARRQGLMGQQEMLNFMQAQGAAQYQQQEAMRQAQAEANQRALQNWQSLIGTLQPHVTPEGKIQPTGNVKGDKPYMQSEEQAMQRIRDIFQNRGVPIASQQETEQQRLQRIAREVLSGQRDFGNVRSSVTRIGSQLADQARASLGLMPNSAFRF